MEEKYNVTKESLIEDLLKIKELCLENPKVTHNSIKAIEVISKMLGYNEPKKIDVTTNGESLNLKDMIDFED